MRSFIAALAAVLIIAAPLGARAQAVPSYGQAAGSPDAHVHGRILTFDGAYALQVRDDKGYVDDVRLHQGTIINPRGLTLAPGMIVSVLGYNAGSYFAANEVDTPYTFYAGRPYYYGHPWYYYGPSVSLGFFFGNAGWWHVNAVYRGGTWQGRNYVAPLRSGGYYHGGGYRHH
jgi:hypothetical protein